jgi:uncharacterized membrane protein
VDKYSTVAATLLGLMILSFVLLIHLPKVAASPGDRIALAVLLRDLSFSAGALAIGIAHGRKPGTALTHKMTVALRLAVAIPILFFGIQHFLHPQYVPVVPLNQTMPSWVPAPVLVSYTTGIALIALGLAVLVNWKSRVAAAWLGVFVFVMVVLVYLPMVVAKPSDIGNGLNYLADTLAVSGTALLLAGALPNHKEGAPERDALPLGRHRVEPVT